MQQLTYTAADTLELKDGNVVQGRFLGGTQALVRFSVNGQVQTYNVTEIVALTSWFSDERRGKSRRPRIRCGVLRRQASATAHVGTFRS